MNATLNVRMGASLKERGDKVLREHGVSTSTAVRELWQELATTRALPEFLQRSVETDTREAAKVCALNELAGVAQGVLTHASDAELHAISEARYE